MTAGGVAGVVLRAGAGTFFFLGRRGAGAGGMGPIDRRPSSRAGSGAGTRTSPEGLDVFCAAPPPAAKNAIAKSATAAPAAIASIRVVGTRVRITPLRARPARRGASP
jgi:hypothetical protein